jgi:16S rRNA (uracil1498-N3)-methyltransferase
MRLHRFYSKTPITNDLVDVSDHELISQWRNVFRYNVGSQVILFDGFGQDFVCLITSLRAQGASLGVIQKIKGGEKPKLNVWLCLALIKKDNFELSVQKATELGVNHIVPILCDKSEKKNINIERLEKIAIEASEQSGRGDVPKIHEIVKVSDLLKKDLLPNRVVYFTLIGGTLKKVTEEENLKDLAVFVGPEGGWSEAEIDAFKTHNVESVCLGSQVLRSETAAISISSLLLL